MNRFPFLSQTPPDPQPTPPPLYTPIPGQQATAEAYNAMPTGTPGAMSFVQNGPPAPIIGPMPAGTSAAVGPTPVAAPEPIPIGGVSNGTAWSVAFQEGFNAGFDAAQGRTSNAQSSVAVHDESYNSAFNAGFQQGFKVGANPNATSGGGGAQPEVPYGMSATGINATQAAALWSQNPELAITLGGTAQYGTPGYNTLQQMNFHPQAIMLASGISTNDPVQNLQNSIDLYNNMGRVGGSMPNAGRLLTNMAYAPVDSEFGAQLALDPTFFYTVGIQVLTASGAGEYAANAFQQQMGRMYNDYGQYLLTSSSDTANLPFNQWLVQYHPEVVQSWSS